MPHNTNTDSGEAPRFSNGALTEEWLGCIDALEGDRAGMREAADFMAGSTAIVHGEVTPCTAVPRLFDRATRDVMEYAATTMHRILLKVMRRYLDDPSYRALFDFDPKLQRLILMPCGHDSLVPFARYDIFLDERTGDFAFCELNADGSSGMNEDREVARATRTTQAYGRFAQTHRIEGNELFESWVDTFLAIYARSGGAGNPHIAICDYLECATLGEFEEYRREFERRGVACSICDVRELSIRDGRLITLDGRPIDAIWRRCVTNDILSHWDDSQEFIKAVEQGLCMLIGGFSGHIVHDKQIFRVLHMPQTHALLTDEENGFVEKHVPLTTFLDERFIDLNDVHQDKDRWVIKPTDHYGADEVHLGIEESGERWRALVDTFANEASGCAFLAQRFVKPFRTLTIPLAEAVQADEAEQDTRKEHAEANRTSVAAPRLYANLSGLYVYDGAFKGVFSRLGPGEIVTGLAGGLTAATFWVDCDRPT